MRAVPSYSTPLNLFVEILYASKLYSCTIFQEDISDNQTVHSQMVLSGNCQINVCVVVAGGLPMFGITLYCEKSIGTLYVNMHVIISTVFLFT
jgi:hypothetical protein